MKNNLKLFSLLLFVLLGTSDIYACILETRIAGPSGRCGADAGVATTYTGSHNFSSGGCTFYEWTIEGGTITGPGGTSVTNGKLCIAESIGCASEVDLSCDASDVDPAVASGTGASVTVVWAANVVGKLKLKAKEKGEITLGKETSITNDIELPVPTSISYSPNTGSNSTFTANLPKPLCNGQVVHWTVDGNLTAIGNPVNLNVGDCTTATVCAMTAQTIGQVTLTSAQTCRSFNGATLIASVSGASEAAVNGFYDYLLTSNQPVTSVNWSIVPATAASIIGTSNQMGILLTFLQSGEIDVCATGTTVCGNSFQRCITVNVTDGGGFLNFRPDEEILAETDRENTQPSTTTAPDFKSLDTETNHSTESNFAVFPTLASQGQEITVKLPKLNDAAFIIISDMQGRAVSQIQVTDSAASISTSDLPTGVFILTAYSGQWMESAKFVVN